jgi:hypothetical protein
MVKLIAYFLASFAGRPDSINMARSPVCIPNISENAQLRVGCTQAVGAANPL